MVWTFSLLEQMRKLSKLPSSSDRNPYVQPSDEEMQQGHSGRASSGHDMSQISSYMTARHAYATSDQQYSQDQRPPTQDRHETCKACVLRVQQEWKLQAENKQWMKRCDELKNNIDKRDRALEETTEKLVIERSLLDDWTKRFRQREEEMKSQIGDLEKKCEDLYIRMCRGKRVYVSHNDFRESINTWYSSVSTFCPKYFPYVGAMDDQAEDKPYYDTGQNQTTPRTVRRPMFYYERQSRLFELILIRASTNFLMRAYSTLNEWLTSLRESRCEQGTDRTTRLPLSPPFISDFLSDECTQVTTEHLANSLNASDKEQFLSSLPPSLRKNINTTKTQVRKEMDDVRRRDGEDGRDDPAIHKQLDDLIISMIIILLTMETSRTCYKFVRIEADEHFDSGSMEAVDGMPETKTGSSEDLRVRIALTRPLMECDEAGLPQTCIAKAKVVLKAGYETSLRWTPGGGGQLALPEAGNSD